MILCLVSACAKETDSTAGEMLIAKPPPDWQRIYQFNNEETRLSDYIPNDENEETWASKLSFESHAQLKHADPIAVIMGEIKNQAEICKYISHSNLFSGFENNYPTSVRLILCGENVHTEKGEVSLIKAIQGNEYFYLIQLVKKVPVFGPSSPVADNLQTPDFTSEEVAYWSTYMKRISLCDTRDDTHACTSNKSGDQ